MTAEPVTLKYSTAARLDISTRGVLIAHHPHPLGDEVDVRVKSFELGELTIRLNARDVTGKEGAV